MKNEFAIALAVLITASLSAGESISADHPVGWRGNWTGRFPDANPPTTWSRTSKAPVGQVLYRARKPKDDDAPDLPLS